MIALLTLSFSLLGYANYVIVNSLVNLFAEKIIRELSTMAYNGYIQEGVYCENLNARENGIIWKPLATYYYGEVSSTLEQQKEWCENFVLEIKKIIRPYLDLVIDVDIVC